MDSAEPPIKKEICDEESTSQKDEGPSTKRKRKPKHYNKPLTEQVRWRRNLVENATRPDSKLRPTLLSVNDLINALGVL
jgi:hypothetical protein